MAAKFEQSESGKSGEEFINYEAILSAMVMLCDKNAKAVIVRHILVSPSIRRMPIPAGKGFLMQLRRGGGGEAQQLPLTTFTR